MDPRWKKILLVVIALIALAVAVGGVSWWRSRRGAERLGLPVFAPKGTVVQGFPTELLLDAQATTSGSYSIPYEANILQRTASFTSHVPMLELFNEYLSYLTRNGWTITNKVTNYSTSRGLQARKGTATVSVVILEEKSSRNVSVTYVTK